MPFRHTALIAALITVIPLFALAEDLPVFIGDEVIVTPTRSPQKLSDTLAATSVITRRDIDASGAIDLPTLLQGTAGVEISQTGGFGSSAAIRLRGTEADHTLVLVDGLRMNSVSSGTTAIEHLPLDEIERIEVVRGNVSSVYGSEAIGGVVRIFTRQGRGEMKPRVTLAAGTDDYGQIHASLGGELQPGLSLYIGAGHTHSGGFSAVKPKYVLSDFYNNFPYHSYVPADTDKDKASNTHFNLRLSQQINDRLSWGIGTLQSRADVDYDGRFSNHDKQNLASYSLYVEGKPTDLWNTKLTLGRSTDELDNDLNGMVYGRYHTRINQLNWENTVLMGRHTFRFGAEGQDQKLKSDQTYSEVTRHSASIYGGAGVKLGAHDIDASLRHDHYSDFGGHTTGRLAYGYTVAQGLKLHGAIGTAFKAPTFNDLYLDFPPDFFANPNLAPERSKSAEVGLTYSNQDQLVQISLFTTRTRDMITFSPGIYATSPPYALITPGSTINLDEARNHGAEVSLNGKLAGLDAQATFTVQKPEDSNTGLSLLRRAQRFGSFAVSNKSGKLGWRAEVVASGPHPDIHVTDYTRISVPGYASLNLSGDYAVTKDWKLTARVLNALDADYSLVHGYATPGRNFRLELAYIPK